MSGEAIASAEPDDYRPVAVTRRIEAPAAKIFGVLADPVRHVELDGSGMLQGADTPAPVTKVGDVFVMRMHYSEHGDYEMNNYVIEFEPNRRIGWEPVPGRGHPDEATGAQRWGHRWVFDLVEDGPDSTIVTEIYDCSRAPRARRESMADGRVWLEAMAATLERLDALSTRHQHDDRHAAGAGSA
jgi:hypothetical protein